MCAYLEKSEKIIAWSSHVGMYTYDKISGGTLIERP